MPKGNKKLYKDGASMKNKKLSWCVVHVHNGKPEYKEFFCTRESARVYMRTWKDIAVAANRKLVLQHYTNA